jgi:DNA polymerase-3 subunit gamma/tau
VAPPAPAAEAKPADTGTPAGTARPAYVRPSRASGQEQAAATEPKTVPAAASADGWPETVPPGSGAARTAAAAKPAAQQPAPGEPDIPLPPEPTDDEEWPHPAEPAAARAAAARTDRGSSASASPPRAAAESAPAPRGGEPTPLVSADPPAADGELTTTDVRRVWPELLAVVKRHKRTTEALLKNAQVHQLSNSVLTLSTSSPALARRLGDDLNKDVIREALNELLGVRWRVDAVVEGAGAPTAAPVAPEVARAAAHAAEAAEASELMAERSADAGGRTDEPAVDPEQAALSLLRAQLGAHPVDS